MSMCSPTCNVLMVMCWIIVGIQCFVLIRDRVRNKYVKVGDAVRSAQSRLSHKVGYAIESRVDEVQDRPVSGWYILLSYRLFTGPDEWQQAAFEIAPTLFGVRVTEVVWDVVAGEGKSWRVKL